jgi:hypothetical protein
MADYRKNDAGGPCQIRVAPGLGFLGQGQSCVRSCSPEGSLGMTPVQQGDEITPLVRRVVDPREGSLYPPRRFGWCVGSLTLVKEAFVRRGVSVGILLR